MGTETQLESRQRTVGEVEGCRRIGSAIVILRTKRYQAKPGNSLPRKHILDDVRLRVGVDEIGFDSAADQWITRWLAAG